MCSVNTQQLTMSCQCTHRSSDTVQCIELSGNKAWQCWYLGWCMERPDGSSSLKPSYEFILARRHRWTNSMYSLQGGNPVPQHSLRDERIQYPNTRYEMRGSNTKTLATWEDPILQHSLRDERIQYSSTRYEMRGSNTPALATRWEYPIPQHSLRDERIQYPNTRYEMRGSNIPTLATRWEDPIPQH